jgi:hypothetical protein
MWLRTKHETTIEQPCRHTLVVHADGTHECEGGGECGGDELLHEWALGCDELGCGCVGEEHDLVLAWAA